MAFNANVPNSTNTIAADVTAINANWEYVISGDGTAGRVFRLARLLVEDGTAADSIKCTLTSVWNGTTLSAEDNLTKSGDSGNFNLNAGGDTITIEAAAFPGNVVACLGTTAYSNTTGVLNFICGAAVASSNNMAISFTYGSGGTAVDLTTNIEAGESIQLDIFYITAA